MTGPRATTRAQRLAMPLARDVVRDLAIEHGGCVHPVQLRRTDLHTGQVRQVLLPCGQTLASACPSCAAQCREGWHPDHEPSIEADEPDDTQKWWTALRADVQQLRDTTASNGRDTTDLGRRSRRHRRR